MKRSGSRFHQFVQRIPADVLERARGRSLAIPVGSTTVHKTVSGKARDIRVSLGTAERSEVQHRHAIISAYLAGVWEALRANQPVHLTHRQAVSLSGRLYRAWVGHEERERTTAVELQSDGRWRIISPKPEEEGAAFGLLASRMNAALEAMGDPADLERTIGPLVDRLLLAECIAEVSEESRPVLLREFARALRDDFTRREKEAGGDYRPDTMAERFPEWTPPEGKVTARPAIGSVTVSASLKGLVEDWWTEAKATGRKPSTYESYRNTMACFVVFLKHDNPARVTPEDVIGFKDHRLASTHPRTGKPISPKTVKDSDLAALKTVFGWAVVNRRLSSNPAEGVTLRLGKAPKLRSKGFTDAEAKALLSAASKHPDKAGASRTSAAKRWVPWLCAYTGARVGEVGQLRRQDVRQDGENWIITITPEAGTQKTNEARDVPLHPHLVGLGFPSFVSASEPGHLFLRPNPKTGDVLGPLQGLKNRLAEAGREVVTDPNVAPNHGWRHRFKTVGREAGIDGGVLDAIQGHAARTVADSYGEVTVKTMAAAIKRIPRIEVD